MAKYLDYAGLQYLWAKIKNYVSTQPLGANVRYDQQTLTTAQQSQARANIMAGGSNRNLLDNPWWGSGEAVNQRNTQSKPSNGSYTIDRWILTSGADANQWAIGANGITFTIASSSIWYTQRILNPSSWSGKTLTASVLLSDGTIKSGSAAFTYGTAATFYNDSAINLSMNAQGQFVLAIRSTQTIRAVKLELGSVSTLANDAPPDYGTELAKCQYYCRVIETSGYFAFGIAAGSAHIQTPLQYAMRARPSVSFTGSIALFGANDLTVSSIVVSAWGPSAVCLDFVTTGATSRTPYIVNMSNAKIVLSADL